MSAFLSFLLILSRLKHNLFYFLDGFIEKLSPLKAFRLLYFPFLFYLHCPIRRLLPGDLHVSNASVNIVS